MGRAGRGVARARTKHIPRFPRNDKSLREERVFVLKLILVGAWMARLEPCPFTSKAAERSVPPHARLLGPSLSAV